MCLSMALMSINLFCAGYSLTERGSGLHLYQGIPFEGTTLEAVSQILLEKTGVPFEVPKEVWDGTADGVLDFGHEWNLRLDFNKKDTRVNRILLSRA